jgi:PAT family beta-lactamase induction signal transducer AmpG
VPFAIVIWVAGTMFKDLGHSDAEITIATATIGIAWSLKPLWAAFLDMARTKKFFVLVSEIAIAALLGAIALALGAPSYFALIIGLLWVLAFASATQDICVDGIYVTSLDERRQPRGSACRAPRGTRAGSSPPPPWSSSPARCSGAVRPRGTRGRTPCSARGS